MNSVSWFSNEQSPIPMNDWNLGSVENAEIGDVFVPYKRVGDDFEVALYNMDPVNWNTFMFSYDFDKYRTGIKELDILNSKEDFDSLVNELQEQSGKNLGDKVVQFEIKKSASTGKITLYVFIYNLVGLDSFESDKEEIRVQISLDDFSKLEEASDKLSSNVIPALEKVISKFN